MTSPFLDENNRPVRIPGPNELSVMHVPDGRTILVLPVGGGRQTTWYELTAEQAEWLSDQLRRTA